MLTSDTAVDMSEKAKYIRRISQNSFRKMGERIGNSVWKTLAGSNSRRRLCLAEAGIKMIMYQHMYLYDQIYSLAHSYLVSMDKYTISMNKSLLKIVLLKTPAINQVQLQVWASSLTLLAAYFNKCKNDKKDSIASFIHLWQSIKAETEFWFHRMTLTMMVYFSKWKNRCKFYFDQRPRNWGTIKCGTTICQTIIALTCFRRYLLFIKVGWVFYSKLPR